MLAVSSLPPADLILFSARIWTGDPARPGAQAFAVKDGRIVAVGTDRKMLRLRGPKTRVIEGKGRRVAPGFIDSHTHMAMGGFNLLGGRWGQRWGGRWGEDFLSVASFERIAERQNSEMEISWFAASRRTRFRISGSST